MKSSIAAPSFRNSGFETTSNSTFAPRAAERPLRLRSRTLSAVPTGTVDLSTTTRYSFMCSPIVARDREHVAQVGRAVFVRRRADRDELEQAVRDAFRRVGRELEAPLVDVALDEHVEAGLVDRDLALLQALDLARVDVDADDVVAGFRQAGARDQADVAGAEDCDFHV